MRAAKHHFGQDPAKVIRSSRQTFTAPLKWKTPFKVFTCSWSDFFHPTAAPWRDEAWDIIRQTPHAYQILTKRALRIAEALPNDWGQGYENVWLGVTVENRRHGLPRMDILRDVPATIRFLSIEPLLEDLGKIDLSGIDWVIVGGEIGPSARPMNPEWAMAVREQCRASGVPFFLKQMYRKAAIPEDLRVREFPWNPAGTKPIQ
jgi:protein gp37